MIALLLLAAFGRHVRANASFSMPHFFAAGAAFAAGTIVAAQFDVVTAWGAISGPYVVSLVFAAGAVAATLYWRFGDEESRGNKGGNGEVASIFWRHRGAAVALVVLVVLGEGALWAGVFERLLGVDHALASTSNRYAPAGFPHLLGTDQLSRDVFLRLCFGGRISLTVGVVAALLSALLGTCIGLFAGTRGGAVDAVLMRLTDAMLSIPLLPLLLITSALDLGGSTRLQSLSAGFFVGLLVATVVALSRVWGRSTRARRIAIESLLAFAFVFVFAVGFSRVLSSSWVEQHQIKSVVKIITLIVAFGWMPVARLARASAIELSNREFVVAARSLGASEMRVMVLHILPSAMAPIGVAATLDVGANILYEAALSFLGLGVKPPVASWGNMLDHALVFIRTDPALAFWPGFIILLTVTCFNVVGDGVREATDPQQGR